MRRVLILLGIAVALIGWQVAKRTTAPTAETTQRYYDNTTVEGLQDWIQSDPQSAEAHARLGLLYLQKARETGDPAFYVSAENTLNRAIELDPEHNDALIGQGILANARHDFVAALEWGEKAFALNPYSAPALGVITDAHVELGNYDEAIASVDQMADMRPNLNSYSRISYVRELHGDTDGAIAAMEAAVEAGIAGREEMLWSLVQLGDLHLRYGDREMAIFTYNQALQLNENYVYALDGLARAAIDAEDFQTAIDIYEPLIEQFPMPSFAWKLGDAYAGIGDMESAERNYELVRVIQSVNQSAGMDVELELVLFDAEHGDDLSATIEQARAVYAVRKSIYAADALAWALYQNGDYVEAKQFSDAALRLGSADPVLHQHAAAIDNALTSVSR